jgi:nucleotide-binding universal stress UspA family protein
MPTFAPVCRLSLKNILFPTDFSAASRAALPFARSLAQIHGSTIWLAHSLAPEPHLQVVTDRVPEQDYLAGQQALSKLDALATEAGTAGVLTNALLDRGDVAATIPAMIREHAIDLVIVGTHGRRGVGKLIMGSAAEKIYRNAICPVMTVGPDVHPVLDWKIRSIVCPVDLAEDPQPVLHYALGLAEENQAMCIVLDAIPLVPWQYRTSEDQRSRRALESLIREQANQWSKPEIVVRREYPAEAILCEAQGRNADLIVMSVHKSRAASWLAHMPWPVASEVVSRAPCPVVTIRL